MGKCVAPRKLLTEGHSPNLNGLFTASQWEGTFWGAAKWRLTQFNGICKYICVKAWAKCKLKTQYTLLSDVLGKKAFDAEVSKWEATLLGGELATDEKTDEARRFYKQVCDKFVRPDYMPPPPPRPRYPAMGVDDVEAGLNDVGQGLQDAAEDTGIARRELSGDDTHQAIDDDNVDNNYHNIIVDDESDVAADDVKDLDADYKDGHHIYDLDMDWSDYSVFDPYAEDTTENTMLANRQLVQSDPSSDPFYDPDRPSGLSCDDADAGRGRRLSEGDDLCFGDLDGVPLMEPIEKILFQFEFTFPIWMAPPISIGGAIKFEAVFGLNLGGQLCLTTMKATLALTPSVTLKLDADVFLDIKIARAGITFSFQMFKLAIQPLGILSIKEGFKTSTEVWLIMEGPVFCLAAFVAIAFPKFCGVVPCGLQYDKLRFEFDIICTEIKIPGVQLNFRKMLFALPPKPDGDQTPPEVGTVDGKLMMAPRVLQKCLGGAEEKDRARITFPNFVDTDTIVSTYKVMMGKRDGDGRYLVVHMTLNEMEEEAVSEEWAGEVDTNPVSGLPVHTCVEACNADGACSMGCHVQIWDASPPVVKASVWDTGSMNYQWGEGMVYSSALQTLRFQFSVSEPPTAAGNSIASVFFGMFDERLCDDAEGTWYSLPDEDAEGLAAMRGLNAKEAEAALIFTGAFHLVESWRLLSPMCWARVAM